MAGADPADHRTARRIADEAGQMLVTVRAELADAGADELRATGDRRAHDLIVAALAEVAPDDAILSEEATDDGDRLDHERVWIVDPLDGTREFSEPPRTDWAVHVALAIEGTPVAGAVALAALDLTLATDSPPPLPARAPGPPRLLVSRTRPPAEAAVLRDALGGELVPMGSAGAKAMAVARGEADIYAHSGGQYEWDSAAPVAVAHAMGLHATRLDGATLAYNQADPYLPDLLICRPEYARPVLEALGA